MELSCEVQSYAWGKVGFGSEVASLQKKGNPDFVIQKDKPYAELWMGTHPNAPSVIKKSNETLSDWISKNPHVLGDTSRKIFGDSLPFLFKVLSINKALSIQAHPNKEHAEQLYRDRPDLYKDPNHKPELAIALTPFEALCGFRPIHEIEDFLRNIPELHTIVAADAAVTLSEGNEADRKEALRRCFQLLMVCPRNVIQQQLDLLLKRHASLDDSSRARELADLIARLATDFPGDVGCFCVYFMNVVTLKPGEALYLGPNEPHAYLSGDCIECMACSDNVVRAGLTPKYIDVDTLCSMLTYNCEDADKKRFQPLSTNPNCLLFSPPVPDFAVAQITIKDYGEIGPCNSASIVLVVKGFGSCEDLSLGPGTVLFLPARDSLTVKVEGANPMQIYQAIANV